jgi:hypothetical protein
MEGCCFLASGGGGAAHREAGAQGRALPSPGFAESDASSRQECSPGPISRVFVFLFSLLETRDHHRVVGDRRDIEMLNSPSDWSPVRHGDGAALLEHLDVVANVTDRLPKTFRKLTGASCLFDFVKDSQNPAAIPMSNYPDEVVLAPSIGCPGIEFAPWIPFFVVMKLYPSHPNSASNYNERVSRLRGRVLRRGLFGILGKGDPRAGNHRATGIGQRYTPEKKYVAACQASSCQSPPRREEAPLPACGSGELV